MNEVVSSTAWAKGNSLSNCSWREGRLWFKDTGLNGQGDKEVELKANPAPLISPPPLPACQSMTGKEAGLGKRGKNPNTRDYIIIKFKLTSLREPQTEDIPRARGPRKEV